MSKLQSLRKLLLQLDPSIDKLLRRSYDALSEKSSKKQFEFLDIVTQNPHVAEAQLLVKLRETYDGAQIHYHVRCITERIYDLLLQDASPQYRSAAQDATPTYILVKKRILLIKILHNKQIVEQLPALLTHAEKIALENEHFDALLELLYMRQELLDMQSDWRTCCDVMAEINRLEDITKQLRISKQWAKRKMICTPSGRGISRDPRGLAAVVDANAQVLAVTPSKQLSYYNLLLKLGQRQLDFDLVNAHKICTQLEELVLNNLSLFPMGHLGEMYGHQAFNALYEGDIPACKLLLAKARLHIAPLPIQLAMLDEMQFLCALHADELGHADQALIALDAYPDELLSADFTDRKPYYKACLHFKKREFQKAIQVIHAAPRIKLEHSELETAMRFLKLMTYAELGDFEPMEQEIESLRKHLRKCSQEPHVHARWSLMFAIFQRLYRNQFNFNKLNTKSTALMLQLATEKSPYRWLATGPELIPFHEWLLDKLIAVHGNWDEIMFSAGSPSSRLRARNESRSLDHKALAEAKAPNQRNQSTTSSSSKS